MGTDSDSQTDQGIATGAAAGAALLHRVVDDVVGAWQRRPDSRVAPVEAEPREIRDWLDRFPLDGPTNLSEAVPELMTALEQWTVHTDHPGYFGLFNPAPTWPGVAGELIAASLNPQLAAWSHAPFAVEVEQRCIDVLGARLGLPTTAGGHLTSGGAEANLTAVLTALTAAFPRYATDGLAGLRAPDCHGGRPVFYVSAEAHLAWLKIAHATGLGRDACRLVPIDGTGRMDITALQRQVDVDREGADLPFLVVATAGTTGAGLIDPLDPVVDLARAEGIRVHVDAAWAGAACLSDKIRPALAGIERADTVTVDAHKWFSVPMGAGMFFTRRRGELATSFNVSTSYMPDEVADTADPYTTTHQWSRRFAGLKLWLSLVAYGVQGYGRQIEKDVALGVLLRQRLEGAGWTIVNDSPLPVVCATHPEAPREPEESWEWHAAVAARVNAAGEAWISPVRTGGRAALRACVISWRTQPEDISRLCAAIEAARMS